MFHGHAMEVNVHSVYIRSFRRRTQNLTHLQHVLTCGRCNLHVRACGRVAELGSPLCPIAVSRLLYPDRPAVTLGPGHTVNIPEVRSISLRQLLHCHKRNVGAFVAAARRLRRVHQIQCSIYKCRLVSR